jgi:hypothetical protein
VKQKTGRTAANKIANFFGSFGYLFCFFQWFWAVMLYFSIIKSVTTFLAPDASNHVQKFTAAPAPTPPNSLELVVLAIIVVIMIAVTIYALIKIPMGIVKTGNKVAYKTAVTMTPIVIKAQHKKDTKKARIKITPKLLLIAKLLLIVIPVVLTAASGLLDKQAVDYRIAMAVGYGLACLSSIFFAVQYSLAGLLRVKMPDLR